MLLAQALRWLQKGYTWKDSPPPKEVFVPVLEKLWAASAEPEPFSSAKGEVLFDRQGWSTKLVLPGAKGSECWIVKKLDGHFNYTCVVPFKNGDEAKRAGANLGRLVEGSRQDWVVNPISPSKPEISSVTFSAKGESFANDGSEDLVKPGVVRAISVAVYPRQVNFLIYARWIKDDTAQRVATLLASGRYVALAKPAILTEPSVTLGSGADCYHK